MCFVEKPGFTHIFAKSSIANYYGHRDKHRCVALNQYEMCLKQLSKKKKWNIQYSLCINISHILRGDNSFLEHRLMAYIEVFLVLFDLISSHNTVVRPDSWLFLITDDKTDLGK